MVFELAAQALQPLQPSLPHLHLSPQSHPAVLVGAFESAQQPLHPVQLLLPQSHFSIPFAQPQAATRRIFLLSSTDIL